jgi:hypothetical protein
MSISNSQQLVHKSFAPTNLNTTNSRILASLHMERADDLFGGPQGSPRTDKLISASVQFG